MNTHSVTITAPGGETWEWVGVTTEQADAAWRLLGTPDHVEGVGEGPTPRHGETNPRSVP